MRAGWIPLLILTFSTLTLSPLAFAQVNDRSSQFGFVYGFSVPDAENTKTFKIAGIKGSAFLSPTFSFGGYFLVSDSSGQSSAQDKFSYSLHGLEVAYHFGGGSGDTFAAARMGISKVNQNPDGNDLTYSPYHYGVASGHDYYFRPWLSVGFEGSYLHVQPGRSTVGGNVYDRPSFGILTFMLALQFRL